MPAIQPLPLSAAPPRATVHASAAIRISWASMAVSGSTRSLPILDRILKEGRARRTDPSRSARCHSARVKPDDRAPLDQALQRARTAAYPEGEFVGQESFMCASEIGALAARAGIAPGT